MANISAADVQKLRQLTSQGMMDCKEALIECDGDFERSIDYLRKKGLKVASKRAEREANQGIVLSGVSKDNNFGINVMVNCETDFVSKNEEFSLFVSQIVVHALDKKPRSLEAFVNMDINGRTVGENLTDWIGKTGEKMQIPHYEVIEAPRVFSYNHYGNRLATLAGFNKTTANNFEEVGHEVAMQIAAMAPVAIDRDDVPKDVIDREIEIGKDQARQEGKPESMIEKIALGKLNKFYKESTLLNQDFVKDNSKTVKQYIEENDKELKVTAISRLMLGA
ncbi:MAG: translation elongation factor Ts [Bacteroidetes bacterium]|nr:translation elongation factor Ts [Bacteroidota bacterium]